MNHGSPTWLNHGTTTCTMVQPSLIYRGKFDYHGSTNATMAHLSWYNYSCTIMVIVGIIMELLYWWNGEVTGSEENIENIDII